MSTRRWSNGWLEEEVLQAYDLDNSENTLRYAEGQSNMSFLYRMYPHQHPITRIISILFVGLVSLSGCQPSSDNAPSSPSQSTPTGELTRVPPTHIGQADTRTVPTATITEFDSSSSLSAVAILVYASEGRLWQWRPEAKVEPLNQSENCSSPRLSQSDDSVVCIKRNGSSSPSLWLFDINSGHATLLLGPDQILEIAPPAASGPPVPSQLMWRPGTKEVLFSLAASDDSRQGISYTLSSLDTETKAITQLVFVEEAIEFSLSPNGRFLALATSSRLDLLDLSDLSWVRDVVPFVSIPFGEYRYFPSPRWDENSSRFMIAIPATENQHSQSDGLFEIWAFNVATLAGQMSSSFTGYAPSASLSPDLSRVAYWRTARPGSNSRDLHIATTDGSTDVTYIDGELLQFLQWSPNSHSFLLRLTPRDYSPTIGEVGLEPRSATSVITVIGAEWVDEDTLLLVVKEGRWPQNLRDQPPWSLWLTSVSNQDAVEVSTIKLESVDLDFRPNEAGGGW